MSSGSSSSSYPNEILVQYENGTTVSYEQHLNQQEEDDVQGYLCAYHVASGAITLDKGMTVSSYYDMMYPCSGNSNNYIQTIQQTVLDNVATYFQLLPDGSACSIPNTALPLWVIGINASPEDTVVSNLSCQKLQTNSSSATNGDGDMCCVVVYAPMTFWWTDGNYDTNDMLQVLEVEFNSPRATPNTNDVTIEYIGAYMQNNPEQGVGDLDGNSSNNSSSINGTTATDNASAHGPKLTAVGGLVVAAMVSALLMAITLAVLAQRRRRQRQQEQGQLNGKDNDNNNNGSGIDGDNYYPNGGGGDDHRTLTKEDTHSDGPTLIEVDVENWSDNDSNHFNENDQGLLVAGAAGAGAGAVGAYHQQETPKASSSSSSAFNNKNNPNSAHSQPRATTSPGSEPPPIPMMPLAASSSLSSSSSSRFRSSRRSRNISNTTTNATNSTSTLSQQQQQQQQLPNVNSWEEDMIYGDDNNNTNNGNKTASSSYYAYTFDLANSMKLDVLGTYSDNVQNPITSMAVVPPYPMMEETSDSEVDSWAQTDGTVGSLEDRLEEITAEI